MANSINLNPVRSSSEAKEKGRHGGIASGQSRRRKRDIRFALAALLEGKQEDGKTGSEAIALVLFQKALDGDLKAIAQIEAWTLAANAKEENEETGLWLGI